MHRIQQLQQQVRQKKLTAVLIEKPQNVRYLCGYIGTNGRLLVTPKRAVLITDFRYLRSARKQLPAGVAIYDQKKGIKKLLQGFKTLGVEEHFVTHAYYQAIKKTFKKTVLKPVSGLVEGMRIIKDEAEIKILRKATAMADECLKQLVTKIKIGVSENDLEWELLQIARRLGADGFSFPPIICFGKNTADVHHIKEPNRLKKGEAVLIDMGIEYQGYMTDMTRTFYTKTPSAAEQKIYSTVLEANTQAIRAIRLGKTTGEIDRVARTIIKKASYGHRFGHSTGHGVGLEVHEDPAVSEKAKNKIQPGMVFTVEPGIYLNDLGGVRIEDMILVTQQGIEVMTKYPKKMTIIKA